MNILVRAPNWMGDAVMATPFLNRLAASRGAVVDVWGKAAALAVYEGMPAVGRRLPLDGPPPRGYETVYILPPSFSAAWLAFRAGIPERVGYAAGFRSPLLTRALFLDERYHYARRYLGLIGEEGRETGPADLFFPASDGLPPDFPKDGPVLAVAPGSRAPARRWPAERFAEVVHGAQGWPSVVLLGAPDDAPFAEAVVRSHAALPAGPGKERRVVNLCGKTSLPVLGGILKRCGALVTNESGLMHAAWAVGTPTVVIAGPSEPRCTSPFGADVRVLQRRDVPCVPCVKNECYRPPPERAECLTRIGSSDVLDALRELSAPDAAI